MPATHENSASLNLCISRKVWYNTGRKSMVLLLSDHFFRKVFVVAALAALTTTEVVTMNFSPLLWVSNG